MKFNAVLPTTAALIALASTLNAEWAVIDAVPAATLLQQFECDSLTGEIVQHIQIKRIVDEHSPALVQAFLDGTVIPEMKIAVATPDGSTTGGLHPGGCQLTMGDGSVQFRTLTLVSYSLTTGGEDDGMEVLTYISRRN